MLVLVDMSDMIYDDIAKEHCGISFEHFVDAVLNMRGTNPVTVQDVKSQLRIMKRMIKDSVSHLQGEVEVMFKEQGLQLAKIRRLVMGDEDAGMSEGGGDDYSDMDVVEGGTDD